MSTSSVHLISRKGSRFPVALRLISCLLILAFLSQEISYAYPDLKPIDWNRQEKLKIDFSLPESVATIEDNYKAPGAAKTVILIQDPHTNTSGQKNIAKTLETLLANDMRYIFLEAGAGDESLSFLKPYASEKRRRETGESFLRSARLQGSEYFNLLTDSKAVLWGAEEMPLYFKSLETYRFITQKRETFTAYLSTVESTIRTLKPRVYNPFLLSFDENYQNYKKGALCLTDYFEILFQKAHGERISLEPYPHLRALKRLRRLESGINFKKANDELATSSLILEEKQKVEKLSILDKKSEEAFFLLLAEKLGGDLKNYPELSKYIRYRQMARRLNPKKVLEEEKILEREVFDSLSMNDDERSLVKISENIDTLRKIFNLTALPDEFVEYQKDKTHFGITHITGFLNKKLMELNNHYDKALFLENGYEDVIQKCEEFYSLTYDRDRMMIQNVLQKMDAEGERRAVLIAGGYHTPSLKRLLKEKGVSYLCITPQILQETNLKRYEDILLRVHAPGPATPLFPLISIATTRSTNMPVRILTGARLGIRDDLALAKSLAGSRLGAELRMVKRLEDRSNTLGTSQPMPGARLAQPSAKGLWDYWRRGTTVILDASETRGQALKRALVSQDFDPASVKAYTSAGYLALDRQQNKIPPLTLVITSLRAVIKPNSHLEFGTKRPYGLTDQDFAETYDVIRINVEDTDHLIDKMSAYARERAYETIFVDPSVKSVKQVDKQYSRSWPMAEQRTKILRIIGAKDRDTALTSLQIQEIWNKTMPRKIQRRGMIHRDIRFLRETGLIFEQAERVRERGAQTGSLSRLYKVTESGRQMLALSDMQITQQLVNAHVSVIGQKSKKNAGARMAKPQTFALKKTSALKMVAEIFKWRNDNIERAREVGVKLRTRDIALYHFLLGQMGIGAQQMRDANADQLFWLWFQYVCTADTLLDRYGSNLTIAEIENVYRDALQNGHVDLCLDDKLPIQQFDKDEVAMVFPSDLRNRYRLLQDYDKKFEELLNKTTLDEAAKKIFRDAITKNTRILLHSYVLERQLGRQPHSRDVLRIFEEKNDLRPLVEIARAFNPSIDESDLAARQKAVYTLNLYSQYIDDIVDVFEDFNAQANLFWSLLFEKHPEEHERLAIWMVGHPERRFIQTQLALWRLAPKATAEFLSTVHQAFKSAHQDSGAIANLIAIGISLEFLAKVLTNRTQNNHHLEAAAGARMAEDANFQRKMIYNVGGSRMSTWSPEEKEILLAIRRLEKAGTEIVVRTIAEEAGLSDFTIRRRQEQNPLLRSRMRAARLIASDARILRTIARRSKAMEPVTDMAVSREARVSTVTLISRCKKNNKVGKAMRENYALQTDIDILKAVPRIMARRQKVTNKAIAQECARNISTVSQRIMQNSRVRKVVLRAKAKKSSSHESSKKLSKTDIDQLKRTFDQLSVEVRRFGAVEQSRAVRIRMYLNLSDQLQELEVGFRSMAENSTLKEPTDYAETLVQLEKLLGVYFRRHLENSHSKPSGARLVDTTKFEEVLPFRKEIVQAVTNLETFHVVSARCRIGLRTLTVFQIKINGAGYAKPSLSDITCLSDSLKEYATKNHFQFVMVDTDIPEITEFLEKNGFRPYSSENGKNGRVLWEMICDISGARLAASEPRRQGRGEEGMAESDKYPSRDVTPQLRQENQKIIIDIGPGWGAITEALSLRHVDGFSPLVYAVGPTGYSQKADKALQERVQKLENVRHIPQKFEEWRSSDLAGKVDEIYLFFPAGFVTQKEDANPAIEQIVDQIKFLLKPGTGKFVLVEDSMHHEEFNFAERIKRQSQKLGMIVQAQTPTYDQVKDLWPVITETSLYHALVEQMQRRTMASLRGPIVEDKLWCITVQVPASGGRLADSKLKDTARQIRTLLSQRKVEAAGKAMRVRVFYKTMINQYQFDASPYEQNFVIENPALATHASLEAFLEAAMAEFTIEEVNVHTAAFNRLDPKWHSIEVYLTIPRSEYITRVSTRPLKNQNVPCEMPLAGARLSQKDNTYREVAVLIFLLGEEFSQIKRVLNEIDPQKQPKMVYEQVLNHVGKIDLFLDHITNPYLKEYLKDLFQDYTVIRMLISFDKEGQDPQSILREIERVEPVLNQLEAELADGTLWDNVERWITRRHGVFKDPRNGARLADDALTRETRLLKKYGIPLDLIILSQANPSKIIEWFGEGEVTLRSSYRGMAHFVWRRALRMARNRPDDLIILKKWQDVVFANVYASLVYDRKTRKHGLILSYPGGEGWAEQIASELAKGEDLFEVLGETVGTNLLVHGLKVYARGDDDRQERFRAVDFVVRLAEDDSKTFSEAAIDFERVDPDFRSQFADALSSLPRLDFKASDTPEDGSASPRQAAQIRRWLDKRAKGARMAESTSSAPRKEDVNSFIVKVAEEKLPAHGKGRLSILIDRIAAIYSLERNDNVLVVETEGGERAVLDLSRGSLENFRQEKHQDALIREEGLEKGLAELQKANNASPVVTSQSNNAHVLMIHLDGFGKNKGAISNFLMQIDQRISGNTHVLLNGQNEEVLLTQRFIDELSLKHKKQYYTSLPDSLKELPTTHLAPVNVLRSLKGLFSGKTHQWVSMESLVNREDGKAGVFAFAPIASLLELVASGDLESARNFFNQITGYSISADEFSALIQGDLRLAALYPIRPLLRTLLRDAERLYILARSIAISA